MEKKIPLANKNVIFNLEWTVYQKVSNCILSDIEQLIEKTFSFKPLILSCISIQLESLKWKSFNFPPLRCVWLYSKFEVIFFLAFLFFPSCFCWRIIVRKRRFYNSKNDIKLNKLEIWNLNWNNTHEWSEWDKLQNWDYLFGLFKLNNVNPETWWVFHAILCPHSGSNGMNEEIKIWKWQTLTIELKISYANNLMQNMKYSLDKFAQQLQRI